jgi:hypothetical protein
MYAAVLQTCKAQQSYWENIPGFAAAVNELEQRLAVLHQTHTEQSTAAVGAGLNKQLFRDSLTDHLYIISKALSLRGLMLNDYSLYLRNKASLSDWRKLSDNALIHKADGLMLDLEAHAATLGEYGITPAFVAETHALMATITEIIIKPRMAILSKKGLTQRAREERERIDRLLKEQLDTMILVFKSSLPAFFNQYSSSRMIIDTGHGTKIPPQPDEGV